MLETLQALAYIVTLLGVCLWGSATLQGYKRDAKVGVILFFISLVVFLVTSWFI